MLIAAGSLILALGLFLLLVKLLVALAWYAAGGIALAGLIVLVFGWFLGLGRA